jgi:hypothetical protein
MVTRPIIFLTLLIIGLCGQAQEGVKREFEQRVRPDQFPSSIYADLQPVTENARRVRYFREFDGENYSWEVKMVYGGRHFSLEYNDSHQLNDIEELVRWRRLDPATRAALSRYFESNYDRFRVKRFQKQFFPRPETDPMQTIEAILSGSRTNPDGYELEADIRRAEDRLIGTYEFQFDKDFNLVSKRKIVPLSHDNLVF